MAKKSGIIPNVSGQPDKPSKVVAPTMAKKPSVQVVDMQKSVVKGQMSAVDAQIDILNKRKEKLQSILDELEK